MGYNLYGAPLFQKAKDGSPGNFYEYTPDGLLKCAISDGMRYAYEYDEMDRLVRNVRPAAAPCISMPTTRMAIRSSKLTLLVR